MKCFIWTCGEAASQYVVFAPTLKKAKEMLYMKYKKDDLNKMLFNKEPRIEQMPIGFVFHAYPIWIRKEQEE